MPRIYAKQLLLAWEDFLGDSALADEFLDVLISLADQVSIGIMTNQESVDYTTIINLIPHKKPFETNTLIVDRRHINNYYFNENDPSRFILIGRDYQQHILPGIQAGWTVTWYNPGNMVCPGSIPLHHAEIDRIATLPGVLQRSQMPSYYQCLVWLQEEGCAPGLWQHVESVAILSYHLALWLRRVGVEVDPILTHRGGLLHDLAKLSAKGYGLNHGEMAGQRLDSKGLPELAEIARRHPLFCLLNEASSPSTWEQKIVYFTDKLVDEGKFVSLEERLTALQKRYPNDRDGITACHPALMLLQGEFCSFLGVTAVELMRQLQDALSPNTVKLPG